MDTRIGTLLGRISISTFAVFSCFILVGLLGVHLKFAMFDQSPIRVAMLAGNFHLDQFKGATPFGYYFNDIIICLVFTPIVATMIFTIVFRRFRVGAAVSACIVLSVVIFFEQSSFSSVGNYVSRSYMMDSIRSGLADPSLAATYVSRATLAKFAVIIAAFVSIWGCAKLASKRVAADKRTNAQFRSLHLALSAPAVGIWILSVIAAPLSFTLREPGSPLNASNAVRAFGGS